MANYRGFLSITKTSTLLISVLLSLLIISVNGFATYAQTKPQDMPEQLYRTYVRAYQLRNTDQCLQPIDSLLRASIALGNHRGELLALNTKFLHEFSKRNNLDAVNNATNAIMAKAREYGMMGFYYNAISNKVVYYVREHRNLEALIYLQEQTDIARRDDDKEGIRLGFTLQGVIQQFRNELSQAIYFYRKGIDYASTHNVKNGDVTLEYRRICDCYRMMGDFKHILSTAKESKKHCKTRAKLYEMTMYECYAHFMLGNYEQYDSAYTHIAKHHARAIPSNAIMSEITPLCKAIRDGREADIQKGFDDIKKSSAAEYYRLKVAYYTYKHDYKTSAEYMDKIIANQYNSRKKTFEYDRKNIDYVYNNQSIEEEKQRLKLRNTTLALANARLSLQNSRLEHERTAADAKVAQEAYLQNELKFKHQQLVSQQLTDSLAAQGVLQKANEQEAKTQHFVLTLLLALTLSVMILTVIYGITKRTLAKRLIIANEKLREGIGKLNVAKDRAQQSERMKMRFVQNMSHEIRTPLNAIVGFSQLLTSMDSQLDTSEKRNLSKYISDNSNMLITLVDDIIDITSLESGQFVMKMSEVNIVELCREALETVRHRKADDVTLNFSTILPDPFVITTDQNRVRQVLINLLTNAEKSTTHGSITLECKLTDHGKNIMFVVTDTGVGIPKEKIHEIFQRFSKLDKSKPGTGLGLDICRTIASKLGGEVNIDPEYSGGARFRFIIPVKQ